MDQEPQQEEVLDQAHRPPSRQHALRSVEVSLSEPQEQARDSRVTDETHHERPDQRTADRQRHEELRCVHRSDHEAWFASPAD